MIEQTTLIEALKTVLDPEVGVNIVDLGLIYAIRQEPSEVFVDMTLTTPACPAGPQILREATSALEKVEGITKAHIKLVMDPPWTQERMSDDAKDQLGIF